MYILSSCIFVCVELTQTIVDAYTRIDQPESPITLIRHPWCYGLAGVVAVQRRKNGLAVPICMNDKGPDGVMGPTSECSHYALLETPLLVPYKMHVLFGKTTEDSQSKLRH